MKRGQWRARAEIRDGLRTVARFRAYGPTEVEAVRRLLTQVEEWRIDRLFVRVQDASIDRWRRIP